eukprot:1747583-Prymnesium_polylepis.2
MLARHQQGGEVDAERAAEHHAAQKRLHPEHLALGAQQHEFVKQKAFESHAEGEQDKRGRQQRVGRVPLHIIAGDGDGRWQRARAAVAAPREGEQAAAAIRKAPGLQSGLRTSDQLDWLCTIHRREGDLAGLIPCAVEGAVRTARRPLPHLDEALLVGDVVHHAVGNAHAPVAVELRVAVPAAVVKLNPTRHAVKRDTFDQRLH